MVVPQSPDQFEQCCSVQPIKFNTEICYKPLQGQNRSVGSHSKTRNKQPFAIHSCHVYNWTVLCGSIGRDVSPHIWLFAFQHSQQKMVVHNYIFPFLFVVLKSLEPCKQFNTRSRRCSGWGLSKDTTEEHKDIIMKSFNGHFFFYLCDRRERGRHCRGELLAQASPLIAPWRECQGTNGGRPSPGWTRHARRRRVGQRGETQRRVDWWIAERRVQLRVGEGRLDGRVA